MAEPRKSWRRRLEQRREGTLGVDELPTDMITTAQSLPGLEGARPLGIVQAEAVQAIDWVDDMKVSLRDDLGGRVTTIEQALARARAQCLRQLRAAAAKLGAGGIVAVHEALATPTKSVLIVTLIGTAVGVDEDSAGPGDVVEPRQRVPNAGPEIDGEGSPESRAEE